MDWENERYVRVYTRDSADWVMLPWQARVVFYELLRKVDRAGVLEIGKQGLRGLAALLRLPDEVVEAGATSLFDDGCVVDKGDRVVMPNFLPAQESRQSDRARQRASRDRRLAESLERDPGDVRLAKGTITSPIVTSGHDGSPAVTSGHSSLAVPFLGAAPPNPRQSALVLASPLPQTRAHVHAKKRRKRPSEVGDATPEELAAVSAALERLSDRTNRKYPVEHHGGRPLALLREGYTEDDLRTVVWGRANKWADDPKMATFLRPSTLFRPGNFAEYIAEDRADWDAPERAGPSRLEPPPSALVAGLLGRGGS